MTVHFDTTTFQFSHGKAPRGTGSWGFAPSRNRGDFHLDQVVFFQGTYAQCKAQARAHFAAAGVRHVVVCP